MEEREYSKDLQRQLKELSQRSEKAAKRIDELESIVASLRNRLDVVQSQLSGERRLRKWLPRI